MEDVVNALSGIYYLATEEDGQPHVRPFDGATLHDGKIYIGTNRGKRVFEQILKNPLIEIFSMEYGMVRLTAKASEVEDDSLNEDIFAELGKDMQEDSVALVLDDIHGELTDQTGEKVTF